MELVDPSCCRSCVGHSEGLCKLASTRVASTRATLQELSKLDSAAEPRSLHRDTTWILLQRLVEAWFVSARTLSKRRSDGSVVSGEGRVDNIRASPRTRRQDGARAYCLECAHGGCAARSCYWLPRAASSVSGAPSTTRSTIASTTSTSRPADDARARGLARG